MRKSSMTVELRSAAVVFCFCILFPSRFALSEPTIPLFTVLELHDQLVIAERKASYAFETMVTNKGGARVVGVVGAVDVPVGGKTTIWLSHTVGGELIGKMLIDVPAPSWRAPHVGVTITARCHSVVRSYALVLGLCNAP
jgi:hypothetical protein